MTDKKNNLENWKKNALNELKQKNFDGVAVETPEGIQIKPLYTSLDIEEQKYLNTLPGEEPFLRGPKATMYTGR